MIIISSGFVSGAMDVISRFFFADLMPLLYQRKFFL
jgi:hypothetical protein